MKYDSRFHPCLEKNAFPSAKSPPALPLFYWPLPCSLHYCNKTHQVYDFSGIVKVFRASKNWHLSLSQQYSHVVGGEKCAQKSPRCKTMVAVRTLPRPKGPLVRPLTAALFRIHTETSAVSLHSSTRAVPCYLMRAGPGMYQ
jgi:hypothetical protein